MEKNHFVIEAIDCTKIWNPHQLVSFLSSNQGNDINLHINPEAVSLRHIGLYDFLDCFSFSKVDIYTHNPLEIHDRYNIILLKKNIFFEHRPSIPEELWSWNKSKKFLSFYHRPIASRLGLASYLFVHYRDQSLIHFNYETDIDRLELFEFDKLKLLRLDSLGEVFEMLRCMPLYGYDNCEVDEKMTWYDYSRDPGITMYKNILIDIVGETHIIGDTFFCTEKTARPIWLKKPFIIFSSRNFLDHLHQMGFLTFNDFWSEEYDGYEGKDRYLKILELIDELSKKSSDELYSMYQKMSHILDHNYNLLQSQTYQLDKITKID